MWYLWTEKAYDKVVNNVMWKVLQIKVLNESQIHYLFVMFDIVICQDKIEVYKNDVLLQT